jgi:hypothetical protein
MRTATLRQLDIIAQISDGEVTLRAMLDDRTVSSLARIKEQIATGIGFFHSLIYPSLAISGKGLRWGLGDIRLSPKLGLMEFCRNVVCGRPVIFIHRGSGDPYRVFTDLLNWDFALPVDSLLNGNRTITVSGKRKGEKLFTHIGVGDDGRASILRHKNGLQIAHAALDEASLSWSVPKPILYEEKGNISLNCQSYLEGSRINVRNLSEEQFFFVLLNASTPIFDIYDFTSRREGAPEFTMLKKIESDAIQIIDHMPLRNAVHSTIKYVRDWLEQRNPAVTLVHGDYTLPNLLFDDDNQATAVVDWEWARPHGCAGFDLMHLGLTATAERFKSDVPTLSSALACHAEVPPTLARFLVHVLPSIGLHTSDIPALAKLVWLVTIFRSAIWTKALDDGFLARASKPMLNAVKAAQ